MKNFRFGLLALAAWALLVISPAPLAAQGEDIFWHDNYKSALEEAQRTGKPIFLEYRCEP